MPRPETVDRAIEEIGKSAANYRYFFEKLNSPTWLGPLAAKGRFSTPPEKKEVEGGVSFPVWPESQYLARMARRPEAQDQVLAIVRAMPATDNINVHADLLEVALALPAQLAAQLVDRARTWVQTPFHSMVAYKIGDLITHLATGGQSGAALRLAEAAFALEPAPTVEEENEWAPLPEPRAHLDDWHYEQGLKKSLPALIAADKERTFALVCALLDSMITLSRRAGDTSTDDYTSIWHSAIEQDETPARRLSTLIASVRDTAETIVRSDAPALANVLAELRRHEWPVFKRIEYHILERFSTAAMADIIPQAVQLAAIEHPARHEAARLLKTAFGQFPPATQEEVLQWIDAGPNEDDVRRVLEFVGQEITPAAIERYSDQWRAQRFALFTDQVPAAWKERVTAVLGAVGETRKLDEIEDSDTWVGPTSPKSADDLEALGPPGVGAFLGTWEAPHGHFVDTHEGLGRILEGVIARNPAGYVEQATTFQELDPTFVRFFFSGLETALKEHRRFSWGPVLTLAAWVLAQPREIPGRRTGLMEADESWQWTRGAIASLLEDALNQRDAKPEEPPTPFAERERVWSIVEPLTHDPDPTPEHEAKYGGDNMDPPTLAINSVRGKAMNAMMAYALWVRYHLDRLEGRPPRNFDVMPEIRGALDHHLDITQDPSLAVRSMYGRYFPQLHLLDPAWTQAAIPRIFPTDPAPYWLAAWNSYLMFCRAYAVLLPVLEPEYRRAVQGLAVGTAKRRGFSPEERLTDHLMTYYWRSELTLESPLLQDFFASAPAGLRGHAIAFLGRSLSQNPDAPLDDAVVTRLRTLWEARIAVAQGADATARTEELSPFGWWFSSQRFDAAWSFAQLRTVLTLGADIEPDFKVAEALEALAAQYPVECVEIVRLMLDADRKGWGMYGNELHFKAILATALASGNATARAAADDAIQYFVTKGQFSYRALLG